MKKRESRLKAEGRRDDGVRYPEEIRMEFVCGGLRWFLKREKAEGGRLKGGREDDKGAGKNI